ncbi:MAG: cell division protein FtsL [Bacilli bacterium]|nr:cell division protein FtsL [Bacilli bacterium]
MANKRISRRRRRRILIIGSVCIFFFVVFCINVVNYSYKIIKLTSEQAALEKQLDELKTEKERLDVEIKKLQDPEYIANFAREEYLYTREGEYVIKIDQAEDTIEEIKKENTKYKYIIVGSIAFLVIISLAIRKKDDK